MPSSADGPSAHATWLARLPCALLIAYGVAFAATALGASVIAFDDHPGQLYRAWHVVRHGFAPWQWDDGWWTGYPELQFYPPGFAYAVALLHLGSFGHLSVGAAYQTVVWLAYLAPGLATFALLARALGDGWLALPGSFVALTVSAGLASGVEGGVHVGMVGARLGWATLPLLMLSLVPWIEGRTRWPFLVPPIVAALVLLHPAHLPAAVATVVLAALVRDGDRRRGLVVALAVLTLAASLTAFWTVPLIARVAETRALAWRSPGSGRSIDLLLPAALLALAALALVIELGRRRSPDHPRNAGVVSMLALAPWAIGAGVLVDAAAERLGVHWLPPNRVVDGYWWAVIAAAGLALARVVDSARVRAAVSRPSGALLAVVALVVFSFPGTNLTLWPRASEWPDLESVTHGLQLDPLWATIRTAPPGRILFVRSGVPLVYGTAWYRAHTHVTALAPLYTDRAIVNGTFTHPSPIAALVYRGTADRAPITALVETLDGRSLFGRPLAELSAATLETYADSLGISMIVALEDDVPHLRAIDDGAAFHRVHSASPFVVYVRRAGVAVPAAHDGRWTIEVRGEPGTWASARIAFHPLWRALDRGRALDTRRGPRGDLQIRVDRAESTIDLVYAPGAPETAGVALSALGLAGWAGACWRARRGTARVSAPSRAPATSTTSAEA